jgi:hypothetical protein
VRPFRRTNLSLSAKIKCALVSVSTIISILSGPIAKTAAPSVVERDVTLSRRKCSKESGSPRIRPLKIRSLVSETIFETGGCNFLFVTGMITQMFSLSDRPLFSILRGEMRTFRWNSLIIICSNQLAMFAHGAEYNLVLCCSAFLLIML